MIHLALHLLWRPLLMVLRTPVVRYYDTERKKMARDRLASDGDHPLIPRNLRKSAGLLVPSDTPQVREEG